MSRWQTHRIGCWAFGKQSPMPSAPIFRTTCPASQIDKKVPGLERSSFEHYRWIDYCASQCHVCHIVYRYDIEKPPTPRYITIWPVTYAVRVPNLRFVCPVQLGTPPLGEGRFIRKAHHSTHLECQFICERYFNIRDDSSGGCDIHCAHCSLENGCRKHLNQQVFLNITDCIEIVLTNDLPVKA